MRLGPSIPGVYVNPGFWIPKIRVLQQYRDTIHLFIGTKHSLCGFTFMSFITDYNHGIDYHGPIGLFIFKSVPPFVSRRVTMPKLPGW
jgi:hypothetical protein